MLGVTAACAAIGLSLAWLLERSDLPGRRIWGVVLCLPFAVPAFVSSFTWVSLSAGFEGLGGAILVMTLSKYPLVFLPVAATLRNLDPSLEESARTLGQNRWGVFFKITLPLLWPSLLAGSLLIALHMLVEFGALSIIGLQTFTTAIYQQFELEFSNANAAMLSAVLLALCLSGVYFYVPYTAVRWRHALTAGLMGTLGIELAKKLLALYLAQIPTYSAIYGAFAAVPILLVWIYVAWVVVLLGAVVAASLPELGRQRLRVPEGPDWHFRLALQVLAHLQAQKTQPAKGASAHELAQQLRVAPADMATVLEVLQGLDWVGSLRDGQGPLHSRCVLLVDINETRVGPLLERLVLSRPSAQDPVWAHTGLDQLRLVQVL